MPNGVEFEGRLAHVGTFPIGIEPSSFIKVCIATRKMAGDTDAKQRAESRQGICEISHSSPGAAFQRSQSHRWG